MATVVLSFEFLRFSVRIRQNVRKFEIQFTYWLISSKMLTKIINSWRWFWMDQLNKCGRALKNQLKYFSKKKKSSGSIPYIFTGWALLNLNFNTDITDKRCVRNIYFFSFICLLVKILWVNKISMESFSNLSFGVGVTHAWN